MLPLPDSLGGDLIVGGLNGISRARAGGPWALVRTSMWTQLRYGIERLGLATAPNGRARLIAWGADGTLPDYRIWTSDDRGETWTPRGPLPDTNDGGVSGIAELVMLGGPSAVAVLGRGRIYRTDDGGATWAVAGQVPGVRADDMRVTTAALGPDGRLYVGTTRAGSNPAGAWVYRTEAPVVVAAAGSPASDRVSLSVEPNPSRGRARIVFTLVAPGPARLAVVDALGREVAVVLDGMVAQGETVVSIETGTWPAGVYVVRATAGTSVTSTRLVVVR